LQALTELQEPPASLESLALLELQGRPEQLVLMVLMVPAALQAQPALQA
jgi:hypothetical protein